MAGGLLRYICYRMKSKVRISLVLMLVSMVVLAAFQAWWLRKSYYEEKEVLNMRTSVLFRETLFGLQVSRYKLDSNFKWRAASGPSNVVGVVNTISSQLRDSALRELPRKSAMMVSINRAGMRMRTDTTVNTIVRYGPDKIFDVLLGSESEKDSLKLQEISEAFSAMLDRQRLDIPFSVKRTTTPKAQRVALHEPPPLSGPGAKEVTIGFVNPITYTLALGNTFPYLLSQIWPQLLFTVFLLGVTILSFLMLYRNLAAQHRLAGIKSEFISNITHELKTPIATVSVAIEALRNFNALQDPQRTKEYLDISHNELQRLSLLVDKVLKLSMFENKAVELKPELLDLRPVVDEVASSMRLQLEKHKAQLSITSAGDTTLTADKLHMTSVVFNLLDNALKYSNALPSIRIELAGTAEDVQLIVIDNGIGIAPEYRQRIFEKFFRVPAGNTHNAKGYGLGLSYVAHVVQQHQGSIEVESQPGIGSRFTIKLPKAT